MDALTPCPPWLLETGRSTLARDTAGRLPHALLIAGLAGVGKKAFGQWLAESILCRERVPDGACGQCGSCRQLLAEAHPDYRRLDPEGASKTIRIDAVRDLVDWLQLTAGSGGRRTAVLFGADTMNRNAANALLKTLEEPGEAGFLILVADRAAALPATVRSRCQQISLHAGDTAAALAWLEGKVDDPRAALARARGLPFTALSILDDDREAEIVLLLSAWQDLFLHRGSVGRIVDSLADLPTARCLDAFAHWTAQSVRWHAGIDRGADPATEAAIAAVAPRLSNEGWFTVHDTLTRLRRSDSASFRTRAVLEGMLADIRIMLSAHEAGSLTT